MEIAREQGNKLIIFYLIFLEKNIFLLNFRQQCNTCYHFQFSLEKYDIWSLSLGYRWRIRCELFFISHFFSVLVIYNLEPVCTYNVNWCSILDVNKYICLLTIASVEAVFYIFLYLKQQFFYVLQCGTFMANWMSIIFLSISVRRPSITAATNRIPSCSEVLSKSTDTHITNLQVRTGTVTVCQACVIYTIHDTRLNCSHIHYIVNVRTYSGTRL